MPGVTTLAQAIPLDLTNLGGAGWATFRTATLATGAFPFGSMRDYYREVSGGKVHCRPQDGRSFENVNHTLAEGVFKLMMTEEDITPAWRKVAVVHAGVSSFVGRRVWDRQWSVPECVFAPPK